MVMDASGALFGTAAAGGAHNAGLLFSLVPNGTQSQFGVIHDFCNRPDCKDGDLPDSELMLDGSGTLYGTTVNGGGNDTDDGHAGGGTLFRVSGTSLQVLHRFCAKDACGDGEYPRGGITTDPLGHLFGTTSAGGKNGEGTVFELLP